MNFQEARKEIESNEFAARVNVASGLNAILEAASEEKAVAQLWSELTSDKAAIRLLARVKEIAVENIDPRYRNPRDTALAVFLWLLNLRNPPLGDIAAEAISKTRQCFWAAGLARQQLSGSALHSGAAETTINVESGEAIAEQVPDRVGNYDTDTSLLFFGVASDSNREIAPIAGLPAIGILGRSSAGSALDRGERSPVSVESEPSVPVLDQAA